MTATLANQPNFKTEEDMRQFMDEVRRYPLLTAQEEKELARRSAQGDEEAIRQLVSANLRLVVAIARRYACGSVSLLDMIQEGAIGLLTAARKFDYTRDVRFSTYASKWIRQGVIRCAAAGGQIRVPNHTAAQIRQITEARMQLLQALEREPEVSEIADLCQIPPDKVLRLLQLQPQIWSLDAPAGEEDGPVPVENLYAPEPHQQLVREELIRIMDQLLAQLTPRQRLILRLRNGMEDGKCYSLAQVAETLGISKERARQVEKQAMDKIKILGSDMGLEDFLE